MEKHEGFLEHSRAKLEYEAVASRIQHFREFGKTFDDSLAPLQAKRCMDCGVPFCQGDTGCPVDNLIPEFNDLVHRGLWKEALDNLHSTNNFPEFTGYLCPAPCESACVLGIGDSPVTIKALERAIIDHGYEESWVEAHPPQKLTGKKIAIIGSGPAGLACAQQLARAGHSPKVFEKNDRLGGLLRYGIPDFKMEKWRIDRRIEQMEQEGVSFETGTHVGKDLSLSSLEKNYDALVLALGTEEPIAFPISGGELEGVHPAMDYLVQANRVVAGDQLSEQIHACNKNVIVIGGGDTGSDCIGTANRQKAKSIINFRRSERPPSERPPKQPWPLYPDIFYVSSSHEEGVERRFAIRPLEVLGNDKGHVKQLKICHTQKGTEGFEDIPNSEEIWDADLILLAMGYRGPRRDSLLEELLTKGIELDTRGNVAAPFGVTEGSFRTNLKGVYACGDARRGQSLIVWAISEGRKCAAQIHRDLSQGL